MDVMLATKRKPEKTKLLMFKQVDSVGADLDQLNAERAIFTDPTDNHKRRTLLLQKINNSWGFTLQTYGIRHKKTGEVEVMTYVDYIDMNGAAYFAGLRRGDVILSVNGVNMEEMTHAGLVSAIKASSDTLRLVVMFEDCCHKVELHDRIIRLKTVLSSKLQELRALEMKEGEIINRYCESRGISRFDQVRQSTISSTSSGSWDRYSIITSPQMLKHHRSIPSSSLRKFGFSQSEVSTDDDSSVLGDSLDVDDSYINITFAESESDSDSNFCCSLTSDDSRVNSLHNSSTNVSRSEIVYEREEFPKKYQTKLVPVRDILSGKDTKQLSPKSLKRGHNPDICTKPEMDRNVKIPFLYLDSVYINEKDEITKL